VDPQLDNSRAAKRFDPRPQLVAEARAFIRHHARGSPRAEDVELAASELATNAIRHAKTPFELAIDIAPHQIRLEVTDESPDVPTLIETSGPRHGLHILDSLAERWGIDRVHGGKMVWAEFSTQ
jgi:anti-sigma regulatory factor (Ser/Thr protein kinase)